MARFMKRRCLDCLEMFEPDGVNGPAVCYDCRRINEALRRKPQRGQKLLTQADLDKAVAAEREACAEICDDFGKRAMLHRCPTWESCLYCERVKVADDIAEDIRARARAAAHRGLDRC